MAGSLDLILESGSPLNKDFETRDRLRFELHKGSGCSVDGTREGPTQAAVRGHCDCPVRGGNSSLRPVPTPWDRTKASHLSAWVSFCAYS